MMTERQMLARRVLSRHSRSFSWAALLLPRWCRHDAAALYAWCRRCDDAVDGPEDAQTTAAAVRRLRAELHRVYSVDDESDPILGGFQSVVRRHGIPRRFAEDLIEGMAMDVGAVRYETFDELLLYCYRVAGTVGLMMAHIMKVKNPEALRRAADLGMAMQLTNICRDVAEDESRGRVYLPRGLLGPWGAGIPYDRRCALAVAELLRRAEKFYRSGDEGLTELPMRCAVAVRAARLIYSDIGRRIARRDFNVRAGRAVVSGARKFWLALRAVSGTLLSFAARRLVPLRMRSGSRTSVLPTTLPFDLPLVMPLASTHATTRPSPPSPSSPSSRAALTGGWQ